MEVGLFIIHTLDVDELQHAVHILGVAGVLDGDLALLSFLCKLSASKKGLFDFRFCH